MPIPEILKQIDAEIARLKQVRNILAGEPAAPKSTAKKTRTAATRQRIGGPIPEKIPTVTVLQPLVRRKRAALPRAVVPAATALTGSVPQGPVAVRAAAVPVRVTLPMPPPRRGILDAANFLN